MYKRWQVLPIVLIISGLIGFFNQSARADSTSILPGSYTSMFPQINVKPPTVTNENYSGIPACPATLICPDINNVPPLNQATCPDNCYVNRPQIPTLGNDTAAICPTGYSASAVYNAQPEYSNNANSVTVAAPIIGMSTYYSYVAQGYICTPTGVTYQTIYCKNPYSADFVTPLVGLVTDDLTSSSGGNNAPQTGMVVQITGAYFLGPGSGTCNLYVPGMYDLVLSIRSISCTLPSGLQKTSNIFPPHTNYNVIPTSTVCTRIQANWGHE